ncbi:hypothetical protein ACFYY8_32080 [Streptosporangium sp. NPDC001559]|uniref:hypothetical protein n=1 Tax=Streptosporangium sp. NPDC001559 TaxID=3366187 RepID=UPI0036E06551
MKTRIRALSLSAATLLTGALLIGGASGANAAPENCKVSTSGSYASSYCASGTGQHRVGVTILHANPSVGYVYSVGPWVSAGATSTAYLPPGTIVSLRTEKR